MNDLWLYQAISNRLPLRYSYKIMLIAFLGTHIPLIALIGYFIARTAPDMQTGWQVLGVALASTLVGTGITLFLLNHLLRPVTRTSRGLRDYAQKQVVPNLPTHYDDEVGTLMADATRAIAKLDAAMDELAHYDNVTAMPNRTTLVRRIDEQLARQPNLAVFAVMLRNHPRIQSTLGSEAANAVLREVGLQIEQVIGPRAVLSRITDHAFGFMLKHDGANAELAQRAEQALAALPREINTGEFRVLPDLALGIALHPADGDSADALLNNALAALPAASTAGGRQESRVRFYSQQSRNAARHRFMVEQELRLALERDEFVLHYQPVVDLAARRVVGAEALIRWNHPERGLVPPGLFIPVAEHSNLIDPISLWVLDAACRQLRDWRDAGMADLKLSINLSARQFMSHDIVATIAQAIASNHIAGTQLEVELTETMAMHAGDSAHRILLALREMGVSAAIDDFGTGYSSMSYLKTLPFDKLKIDREFVSGVEQSKKSGAICKALIELAQGLDIQVLAEGTETAAEVAQLSALGCHMYQGYYFARPMPAADFAGAVNDPALRASIDRFTPVPPSGLPLPPQPASETTRDSRGRMSALNG